MHASLFGRFAAIVGASALALGLSQAAASADDSSGDPGVARVSVLLGAVDVKRSDSGDTFAASVNAPVSVGDYITTGDGAHAEIQYTFGASLRVASDTQLRFTRLDSGDHVAQLAAGTVELRLFRGLGAHPEVATPAATVRPTGNGSYRITVSHDGNSVVTVRSGNADVITQAGTRSLSAGSTLSVSGTGDATQVEAAAAVPYDDFDRWNGERDAYVERTRDFGYVDQGIVGADDLDRYGRWEDSSYGRAWRPNVDPGWAPYNDGRWTWQPYYGWTWVAAEPWGWAPYHYGRWFYASNAWCWSPGVVAGWPVAYSAPVFLAPAIVYQPALVAFFSFGSGFGGLGFGNIGWVPLAPFETFHPWWGSRYANRTTVNNITNINNVTNVTNVNNYYGSGAGGSVAKMYRNAAAPGGAVGVKVDNFTSGRFGHVVALEPGELAKVSPVRGILPVVPTAKNLEYSNRPPAMLGAGPLERRFAAFGTPKVVTKPFNEQLAALKEMTLKMYPKSEPVRAHSMPAERRPVGGPAEIPHATVPAHSAGVERIEGSTRVSSPWDRFDRSGQAAPARGESASHEIQRRPSGGTHSKVTGAAGTPMQGTLTQGVPAQRTPAQRTHAQGVLDAAPAEPHERVRTATFDPFSRFGDSGYSLAKQHSNEPPAGRRLYAPTRSSGLTPATQPYGAHRATHLESVEPAQTLERAGHSNPTQATQATQATRTEQASSRTLSPAGIRP